MVHEYINSPILLTNAVNEANAFIGDLQYAMNKVLEDIERR